jgi:hypothetical protein
MSIITKASCHTQCFKERTYILTFTYASYETMDKDFLLDSLYGHLDHIRGGDFLLKQAELKEVTK